MMNSLAQRRRLRRVSLGHFVKIVGMPYSKFDVGRWISRRFIRLRRADKCLLASGEFDVHSLFVLTAASLILESNLYEWRSFQTPSRGLPEASRSAGGASLH